MVTNMLRHVNLLEKVVKKMVNYNWIKPSEYLDKRNIKYKEPIGFKNLLPYRYMLEVYKDRKDILDLLKK